MMVFFFIQILYLHTNIFKFKNQHISIVPNLVYVVFQRNMERIWLRWYDIYINIYYFMYIILCGSEFTCRTNYKLEIEHRIILYAAYFFRDHFWNIPVFMSLNWTLNGIFFLNKWFKVIFLSCISNNRSFNCSGIQRKRGGGNV